MIRRLLLLALGLLLVTGGVFLYRYFNRPQGLMLSSGRFLESRHGRSHRDPNILHGSGPGDKSAVKRLGCPE